MIGTMSTPSDENVLLHESTRLWEYYNAIQANNQRLFENYFRSVSAFGAILGISAAILNSDGFAVELAYQMMFIGVAGIGGLGLAVVGYSSIITFAREVGNSEIYLAAIKDIRVYLWPEGTEDNPPPKPIHSLRTPIKTAAKVSDARLRVFISLNAFVISVAAFIITYGIGLSYSLLSGHYETYLGAIGQNGLVALIFGVVALITAYVIQDKKAQAAKRNYVSQRLGPTN